MDGGVLRAAGGSVQHYRQAVIPGELLKYRKWLFTTRTRGGHKVTLTATGGRRPDMTMPFKAFVEDCIAQSTSRLIGLAIERAAGESPRGFVPFRPRRSALAPYLAQDRKVGEP